MGQLPASGEISASMINIALGNPFNDAISWDDIATEYNLSSPNYGDSNPGLGLDELYGLYPAAGDFIFSDAFPSSSDTGWTIANATAQVFGAPSTNEGTISTITYNGTVSTNQYAYVFTDTTRTADVVVTIPQTDPFSQNYNNYPGSVSGQITTIQDAYRLRDVDLNGDMSGINSQTGLVSWTAGNDNAGPAITNTNFTKLSTFTINPGAGEAAIVDSNFSVITADNQRVGKSSTIYFGVPTTAQGSGQYGNVGSVVTKTTSTRYQESSQSLEVIAYPGGSGTTITETGPGTASVEFAWNASGPTNGKTVHIDITNGYDKNNIGLNAIVKNTHYDGTSYPGSPQSDDKLVLVSGSTNTDSGSTGGGIQQLGSGWAGESQASSPPIRFYMDGNNTSTTTAISRSIDFYTYGGGYYILNVYQLPNITFSISPSSSILSFLSNGSTSQAITITTNQAWTAAITNNSGATFSFSSGFSSTSTSGTGNGSVTVYTTAANTAGTARTGNITVTPTGFASLAESNSLSQAGVALLSNMWANITGFWNDQGTSITNITRQQSSTSPYGFSPTYFPVAMKGNYSQNYSVSITVGNYVTIGTTNSGGSTSLSSLSNTTSTPSSSQFYIVINGSGLPSSGTQWSTSTYYTTSLLVSYDNGTSHIINIKLQGSDTGGGTTGTRPGGPED